MPQKILNLVLCVICAWKISKAYVLFSNKGGESMGHQQNLGPNRVKSSKFLESEDLDKNNEQLQQELSACQNFFDNTEMKSGRHPVFNFKLSELNLNEIKKKSKEVFQKSNCAAKVNLALGFILRNVDTDKYWYLYANENKLWIITFTLLK